MGRLSRHTIIGLLMTILMCHNSAFAANTITPAEAVQKVRKAVGIEALRKNSRDVLITGVAEHLGMTGALQFYAAPNGEFLQLVEAHGEHALGFDGKVLWERAFSRKALILDFGDAETLQAFMAIRTHHWLAESSPYQVALGAGKQKEGECVLQISKPGDLIPTQIVLDSNNWLPIRASRPGLFGDDIWEFSNYAEFNGTKWPRKSQLRQGMSLDIYDLKTVQFVPPEGPNRYSVRGEVPPFKWDANLSSLVELKRTPSGHFFVKVKVNGQDVGWFALDTGTGVSMTISQKVADRLHLPAYGKTFAGGASHQNPAKFREAESIQVGPATLPGATCFELPASFTDSMTKLFGFEWGGTLGHGFLSQVVAELDLSATTLTLRDPKTFELKPGEWQPLRLNHGIPCLRCKVENRYEGWFQFDTGAGMVAIIHSPAVEKHKLLKGRETRSQPLQGVGGTIDAQMGRLAEFSIGTRTMSNVLTFFVTGKEGALVDPYTMGTFGAGILNGDKVIFDYSHRRAALVKKETKPDPAGAY